MPLNDFGKLLIGRHDGIDCRAAVGIERGRLLPDRRHKCSERRHLPKQQVRNWRAGFGIADPCDRLRNIVGDDLDRREIVFSRSAHTALVNCERAHDVAVGMPDRRRPAGAEPVGQREIAVRRPQRIGSDVGDIYRQPNDTGTSINLVF